MSNLYLLPISVFLLFNFTFIGTYIAAVLQGHVVPTVPYISDAATYSPESCVFGQFINIGCVLRKLITAGAPRAMTHVCKAINAGKGFRLQWGSRSTCGTGRYRRYPTGTVMFGRRLGVAAGRPSGSASVPVSASASLATSRRRTFGPCTTLARFSASVLARCTSGYSRTSHTTFNHIWARCRRRTCACCCRSFAPSSSSWSP
uniref:CWH43-like N-terminal domain-containing protein n=1 Tax=Anopheles atroparvus TaxID=41427 RepID=A0AAG5DKT0_ANOAO